MKGESDEKRPSDRIKFIKSPEDRVEKANDVSSDISSTISEMDLSESDQLRRHFQGIEISQSDRDKIQNRLNKIERLERGRLEKDVSLNERTQIQKMLTASVDRKIIEDYRDYINPDKKRLKIEDITHFQAEKEFKERYKEISLKENPDLPEDVLEAEANSLAGYVDSNGKIYVNESKRGHYNTLLHEKIHHVSAKELRDQMGIGMDEGMTEYFARKSGANEVFEKDIDLVFDPQTHRLVNLLI